MHNGHYSLAFDSILTIDSYQSHLDTVEYLREAGRPAVVNVVSGMCAAGRIQNYLKALPPDKRTNIFLLAIKPRVDQGVIFSVMVLAKILSRLMLCLMVSE